MRIGELARETGVPLRLLRYYEEQGLLTAERSRGGHRRYDPEATLVVLQIRALLAAGLPTTVIREVLPFVSGTRPHIDACGAEVLQDRLHSIDKRIATLSRTRAALAAIIHS